MYKLLIIADSLARSLRNDHKGVTAVEYGLIAGLIAVAIIAALGLLGTDLNNLFDTADSGVYNAANPGN